MALTDDECQKCRVELDKLKALYEGAGEVPDVAKARLSELESALDSECSSSDAPSSGGYDAAGVVVTGLVGIGFLAAFIAAIYGSRQ
ncbi:unnamed protein product [marine sediment metagenome]|uniref:Uncharacterized protein n=1 Tax=marine sediment metagenome TaxID=412755 RepID=X1QIE8_9ZZZZ